MEQFPLFTYVELETASMCNRRCPTCIRQSHPDQEAMRPWHEHNLMPIETIHAVFAELGGMGYRGIVNLSHFNEPLLDERIPAIARLCRKMVPHCGITMFSNGDALTESLAAKLNGIVDQIVFALYDDATGNREEQIRDWFRATPVRFTGGVHIISHYHANSYRVAVENIELVCLDSIRRLIINHKGEMMMCCEDIPGHFDFGSFPERSLVELWNDPKHVEIVDTLLHCQAGRRRYALCRSCPKNGD